MMGQHESESLRSSFLQGLLPASGRSHRQESRSMRAAIEYVNKNFLIAILQPVQRRPAQIGSILPSVASECVNVSTSKTLTHTTHGRKEIFYIYFRLCCLTGSSKPARCVRSTARPGEVDWLIVFSCAAHNLLRLPRLMAQPTETLREQCA